MLLLSIIFFNYLLQICMYLEEFRKNDGKLSRKFVTYKKENENIIYVKYERIMSRAFLLRVYKKICRNYELTYESAEKIVEIPTIQLSTSFLS